MPWLTWYESEVDWVGGIFLIKEVNNESLNSTNKKLKDAAAYVTCLFRDLSLRVSLILGKKVNVHK